MENFHTFVDYVLITKRWEYGIAFAFMFAFIFFFTYLQAPKAVPQKAAGLVRRAIDLIQGFLVPENLYFHQGHAWARVDSDSRATIGLDDFAQKLVGRITAIDLPKAGAILKQGEKAWKITVDSKEFEMLSPIEGKVVAVNPLLASSAQALKNDPYGKGWMLKIESPSLSSNLKNLFKGDLAKKWTEKVLEDLSAKSNLDLGLVLADGGAPIDGMAKALDRENWDLIVRESFLTEE